MPANTLPVFTLTPVASFADFSAVTACTTRAPTATAGLAAANIIILAGTSTNGKRIDIIRVKGSSSSITAATATQLVTIWKHDGTKAYPMFEILIQPQTPSTTSGSFEIVVPYTGAPLAPTHSLFASTTITTTASTTAFVVHAEGGDY